MKNLIIVLLLVFPVQCFAKLEIVETKNFDDWNLYKLFNPKTSEHFYTLNQIGRSNRGAISLMCAKKDNNIYAGFYSPVPLKANEQGKINLKIYDPYHRIKKEKEAKSFKDANLLAAFRLNKNLIGFMQVHDIEISDLSNNSANTYAFNKNGLTNGLKALSKHCMDIDNAFFVTNLVNSNQTIINKNSKEEEIKQTAYEKTVKSAPKKEEITMCNNLLKYTFVKYNLITANTKDNILSCMATTFQGYSASLVLYEVNLDTMVSSLSYL